MKRGGWRINRSASMLPSGKKAQYKKIRFRLLEALGNKCSVFGFSDERALQIDHFFSDGKLERHITGASLYYHMFNNIESGRYQILCANCNWIKRREKNEVKIKYENGHEFQTESPHKRVFRPKICKNCNKKYIPTNGTQLFCHKLCVKG